MYTVPVSFPPIDIKIVAVNDDGDDGDYNVISAGLGHMCPNPQNGLFQCF